MLLSHFSVWVYYYTPQSECQVFFSTFFPLHIKGLSVLKDDKLIIQRFGATCQGVFRTILGLDTREPLW